MILKFSLAHLVKTSTQKTFFSSLLCSITDLAFPVSCRKDLTASLKGAHKGAGRKDALGLSQASGRSMCLKKKLSMGVQISPVIILP